MSFFQSDAHGGAVLSLLHDRTTNLTGCGQLQEVMLFLTQSAAVPYMDMLTKWLKRGIINDPYHEVSSIIICVHHIIYFLECYCIAAIISAMRKFM